MSFYQVQRCLSFYSIKLPEKLLTSTSLRKGIWGPCTVYFDIQCTKYYKEHINTVTYKTLILRNGKTKWEEKESGQKVRNNLTSTCVLYYKHRLIIYWTIPVVIACELYSCRRYWSQKAFRKRCATTSNNYFNVNENAKPRQLSNSL